MSTSLHRRGTGGSGGSGGSGGGEGGGFTIIEVLIAMVVVSTMVVAAMKAAAMAATSRTKSLWRVQAQQLAGALMAEVLTRHYEDPTLPTLLLGPDLGESATDRTTWDDIDDYAAYTQSPPRGLDGNPLLNDTYWSWSVSVEWVSSSAPGGAAMLTESGLKRVTVIVKRNGLVLETLVGMRGNVT